MADKMRNALIFDLDGVLVDSETMSHQIWEQVMADRGIILEAAVYARMIGRRSEEGAAVLIAHYGLGWSATELAAVKNNIWEQRWPLGLPPMPGLYELMAAVRERQLTWAVATSSPRHYAERILADLGIGEQCMAIAAGNEVAVGKPAPDLYLLAAQRLGVPAGSCFAFEDSVAGGLAAQAAGMKLVAVPAGVSTPADFPFATHIFTSLTAIAAKLDSLLKNES